MSCVFYWVNCTTLGDTICCIPVAKELIAEDRLDKVMVPARFSELFRLCGIDDRFIIEGSKEQAKKYIDCGLEMVPAIRPGFAPLRLHLIDSFSVFTLNAILKPEEKNIRACPEKIPPSPIKVPYIVIGVGHSHDSRKMPEKCYDEIVKYAKKAGNEIVLLGGHRRPNSKYPTKFEGYSTEGCTDLNGKTSLTESVAILNNAECVVTVDSGLVYLASLTDVPIVCGYTFVDPHYRMPWRHNKHGWGFYPIEPRSECKYCSNKLAMFGVTFDTTCPFGKDYECATSLTGSDFIKAIKKAVIQRSKNRQT